MNEEGRPTRRPIPSDIPARQYHADRRALVRPPFLDVLAAIVALAARQAPGALHVYAAVLARRARFGRSLTAAEAVVVDAASAWRCAA